MDEITLINLLNKICDINPELSWQLNCKYHDGMQNSVMEVALFHPGEKNKAGLISFKMESGSIIRGNYRGMVPFNRKTCLTDALLEILHYEQSKLVSSLN